MEAGQHINKIEVGGIFWIKQPEDISHPHVILEIWNDKLTVCSITTNTKKRNMPGNVTLEMGEGNLDKLSTVEVSKVNTIETSQLKDYIGKLTKERVTEILNGIGFLERTYFNNRQ